MRDDVAGPDGSELSEGLGAGAEARCWCRACDRPKLTAAIERHDFFAAAAQVRFIVCPHCGDKRCLHAWNHEAPCAKVDLYAHNAWVERMALRANPRRGEDCHPDEVIALGAWEAPNAK